MKKEAVNVLGEGLRFTSGRLSAEICEKNTINTVYFRLVVNKYGVAN